MFFFIHIKLNSDWVGITESISGNQDEKKKIFAKRPTNFFWFPLIDFDGIHLCQKIQMPNIFFDNFIILTNISLLPDLKKKCHFNIFQYKKKHKPTGQAVWTDPSWCNFTDKKNPLMQQNCHNSWTSHAVLMTLKI